MALLLTIPGGKTQLSGNRIQAEVETDTITGTGYKLLLKTTSLDSSFPEGLDAIDPDSNNKATFDIRNRVKLPVDYSFTWPLDGSVAVEQPQMAKKVALDIGERYIEVVNNVNNNQVNWSELAGEQYQVLVLKGGVSKHQQAKYNEQGTTFYNEFIAAGKFLTLLPDNQKIVPGQPVKLWYVTKEAAQQALVLKVEYTLLDTTTGTINHNIVVNPDTMVELCVDPASLGLNTSLLDSYSVSLEKTGIAVSEVRSFTVDHNYYENTTFLLYTNLVGGIDSVCLAGHLKKMFPTTSEKSNRDARITDTQKKATVEVDYKAGRRKWEINTGYHESDEMEPLTALFESTNIWLLQGNDIVPVILEDGDNAYYDSMEDIHNMDLVFTEAH